MEFVIKIIGILITVLFIPALVFMFLWETDNKYDSDKVARWNDTRKNG